MKYTYEEITTIKPNGDEVVNTLKRTDENGVVVYIPLDESNSDYQRYLNPDLENGTIS